MPAAINVDLDARTDLIETDAFFAGVPYGGLVTSFRDSLFTLDGSAVDAWGGYNGYSAVQTTDAARPAYAAGVVTGDGSADYLVTDVYPGNNDGNDGGYFAARVVPGTINSGSARYLIGAQQSSTQRLVLGVSATGLLNSLIGNVTLSAVGAPTTAVPEVIGVGWDGAGNCELRRNGTQVDTDTYSGGVGNLPFFVLVRNFAGAANGFNDWGMAKWSLHLQAGGFSDSELDAIDAALAL